MVDGYCDERDLPTSRIFTTRDLYHVTHIHKTKMGHVVRLHFLGHIAKKLALKNINNNNYPRPVYHRAPDFPPHLPSSI